MRTKLIVSITVAVLIASMVAFMRPAYADPDMVIKDLIAGGGNPASAIDVGDITVWNDLDNLYVKYDITEEDWYLTETHLAVATDLDEIPQTKKGNPIPGQFEYSTIHDPPVTEYTYTIPLEWDVDATLYIAAHAKVVKLIGDCASWQWATEVIDFKQGTLVGGGEITDPARTDPSKALGPPDGDFYSLGFVSDGDGYIELGFGYPVYNGLNPDVRTIEITWGRSAYPEERANVYVWPKGGTSWIYIGTVTNHDSSDGSSYVNIPEGVTIVEKIKLVDATDKANFPPTQYPTADGFDLDAVGVHYLLEAEETAWGDGIQFPGENWATYFTYKVQGWNVEGDWVIRVYYGKTYDHDFTFSAVQNGGTFTGTGGYPAGGPPYSIVEVVNGTVSGNIIKFHSVYVDSSTGLPTGYYWDAVGTIAPNGTMSGTWTSSTGQSGNWESISGAATWE